MIPHGRTNNCSLLVHWRQKTPLSLGVSCFAEQSGWEHAEESKSSEIPVEVDCSWMNCTRPVMGLCSNHSCVSCTGRASSSMIEGLSKADMASWSLATFWHWALPLPLCTNHASSIQIWTGSWQVLKIFSPFTISSQRTRRPQPSTAHMASLYKCSAQNQWCLLTKGYLQLWRDSYVSVLIFHPFYPSPNCLTVIPSLWTPF